MRIKPFFTLQNIGMNFTRLPSANTTKTMPVPMCEKGGRHLPGSEQSFVAWSFVPILDQPNACLDISPLNRTNPSWHGSLSHGASLPNVVEPPVLYQKNCSLMLLMKKNQFCALHWMLCEPYLVALMFWSWIEMCEVWIDNWWCATIDGLWCCACCCSLFSILCAALIG